MLLMIVGMFESYYVLLVLFYVKSIFIQTPKIRTFLSSYVSKLISRKIFLTENTLTFYTFQIKSRFESNWQDSVL